MEQGKAESQQLMDAVLSLAEQLLAQHGEFFPYGGAMTPSGEIVSVAAYDGDEHPPSSGSYLNASAGLHLSSTVRGNIKPPP